MSSFYLLFLTCFYHGDIQGQVTGWDNSVLTRWHRETTLPALLNLTAWFFVDALSEWISGSSSATLLWQGRNREKRLSDGPAKRVGCGMLQPWMEAQETPAVHPQQPRAARCGPEELHHPWAPCFPSCETGNFPSPPSLLACLLCRARLVSARVCTGLIQWSHDPRCCRHKNRNREQCLP